jgi:hypothetical protein
MGGGGGDSLKGGDSCSQGRQSDIDGRRGRYVKELGRCESGRRWVRMMYPTGSRPGHRCRAGSGSGRICVGSLLLGRIWAGTTLPGQIWARIKPGRHCGATGPRRWPVEGAGAKIGPKSLDWVGQLTARHDVVGGGRIRGGTSRFR